MDKFNSRSAFIQRQQCVRLSDAQELEPSVVRTEEINTGGI